MLGYGKKSEVLVDAGLMAFLAPFLDVAAMLQSVAFGCIDVALRCILVALRCRGVACLGTYSVMRIT